MSGYVIPILAKTWTFLRSFLIVIIFCWILFSHKAEIEQEMQQNVNQVDELVQELERQAAARQAGKLEQYLEHEWVQELERQGAACQVGKLEQYLDHEWVQERKHQGDTFQAGKLEQYLDHEWVQELECQVATANIRGVEIAGRLCPNVQQSSGRPKRPKDPYIGFCLSHREVYLSIKLH